MQVFQESYKQIHINSESLAEKMKCANLSDWKLVQNYKSNMIQIPGYDLVQKIINIQQTKVLNVKNPDVNYMGTLEPINNFVEKTCRNGDYFRGQWELRPNGYGEMVYFPGGDSYKGLWRDGHYGGYGELNDKNGANIYKGLWKDSKYHGYGETYFNNRITYQGLWVNGQKHGYGENTEVMGKLVCGQFVNGKFQSKSKYLDYNELYGQAVENGLFSG